MLTFNIDTSNVGLAQEGPTLHWQSMKDFRTPTATIGVLRHPQGLRCGCVDSSRCGAVRNFHTITVHSTADGAVKRGASPTSRLPQRYVRNACFNAPTAHAVYLWLPYSCYNKLRF